MFTHMLHMDCGVQLTSGRSQQEDVQTRSSRSHFVAVTTNNTITPSVCVSLSQTLWHTLAQNRSLTTTGTESIPTTVPVLGNFNTRSDCWPLNCVQGKASSTLHDDPFVKRTCTLSVCVCVWSVTLSVMRAGLLSASLTREPRVSVAHQLPQKKTLASRKPWNGSGVDPLLTHIAAHAGYFSCDEAAQIQRRRDAAALCWLAAWSCCVLSSSERRRADCLHSFNSFNLYFFRRSKKASGLIIFDDALLWLLTRFIFTTTRMSIVSEILSPQNKGILVWQNRRLRPRTCTTLHSRQHIFCLTVTWKSQQHSNMSATGVFKVWFRCSRLAPC